MKLAFAVAWLVCANVQNAAQFAPDAGPRLQLCGSAATMPLPTGKHSGRDCPGACHALCRKHGIAEESGDE